MLKSKQPKMHPATLQSTILYPEKKNTILYFCTQKNLKKEYFVIYTCMLRLYYYGTTVLFPSNLTCFYKDSSRLPAVFFAMAVAASKDFFGIPPTTLNLVSSQR